MHALCARHRPVARVPLRFVAGGTFEDTVPTRQRAGSRMRDVPSFDSIEQAAAAAAADPKRAGGRCCLEWLGGGNAAGPLLLPSAVACTAAAGACSRSLSSRPLLPSPPPPGRAARKTTITLNLSRQISGLEAAGGGNAQTPGTESLGVARAQQRPGSAPPRKAVTPAPLPVAPATEGYQRNRRAAAAGVHAVAAEVRDG